MARSAKKAAASTAVNWAQEADYVLCLLRDLEQTTEEQETRFRNAVQRLCLNLKENDTGEAQFVLTNNSIMG
jgi:hypothetical protein